MAELSVDACEDPTPICRCRVLYMGSAVPHITKDGLQGIQEPLKELYPEQGAFEARGIDSWLSVWSNGILLENVDENHKKITRFFPIETLHFCAAVRYVLVPERNNPATPRFLPLDSPFAHGPNPNHPPLFAAILRRTSGIKVLECHAFISKVEAAANALVRCCFHAYADSSYAKQIDERNIYGTVRGTDTIDRVEGWRRKNRSDDGSQTLNNTNADYASTMAEQQITLPDEMSIYNGDENHKVWAGASTQSTYNQSEYNLTLRSGKLPRPRQAASYVPPPLPPARETKKKKNEPKVESSTMRPAQSMYNMPVRKFTRLNGNRPLPPHMVFGPGPQVLNNGTVVPPMYGSATMRPLIPVYNNGTMMAGPPQAMMHNETLPRPHPIMFHPHHATLPNTRSKRKKDQFLAQQDHHYNSVPLFIPIQPPAGPNQPLLVPMPTGTRKKKQTGKITMVGPRQVPEPTLFDRKMAQARAQAEAEAEAEVNQNGTRKKRQPGRMSMGNPSANISRQRYMEQRRAAEEAEAHAEAQAHAHANGDESPFNTGIYRKKGHLNERAFSYSIRQEHRSRSYGSLANLQFASPIPNEPSERMKPPTPQPFQSDGRTRSFGSLENIGFRSPVRKKYPPSATGTSPRREHDLMQIMSDLEISGDELERSEVPKSVYESKRLAAVKANAAIINQHRK